MKILILNWKDIKNPKSGGAEILTHEIAKRFVKKGHEVTLFASYFKGAKKRENIEGVIIIRDGELDLRALKNSVHYKAYRYYKKNLIGKIDVIIDEVHGMPFFAKFYAREKVVALICEVADDIWFRMLSFPWNYIGWCLERVYLFFYKGISVLTISESTKKELIDSGLAAKEITVLPMGITRFPARKIKKEKTPTLIFVGRLNKMKGVEDAINAVAQASKKIKNLKLWIVGQGEPEYMNYLKTLVRDKWITDQIIFWNYVSQQKKFELMGKSHAIIVPSLREGFGLIVPEAGSVGTPAIAYDVHGLRDTIKNKKNGFLVNKTPLYLAKGIESLFNQKNSYSRLSKSAYEESKSYDWENTAKIALTVLKK